MRRGKILSLLLAAVTALTAMIAPVTQGSAASAGDMVRISNVKYSVYLRKTPSTNSVNITEIPVGTEVKLVERTNSEFSKVNYRGTYGYVLNKYLTDVSPIAGGGLMFGDEMYVTDVENSIYLRSAPSDSGKIITTIPVGTGVSYQGEEKNGFFKVKYKDKIGYSKVKYLTPNMPKLMKVTGVKYSIYLRTTPASNSKNIMEIPVGAVVTYVSNAGNGYYKINYNGNVGYATAAYLK